MNCVNRFFGHACYKFAAVPFSLRELLPLIFFSSKLCLIMYIQPVIIHVTHAKEIAWRKFRTSCLEAVCKNTQIGTLTQKLFKMRSTLHNCNIRWCYM